MCTEKVPQKWTKQIKFVKEILLSHFKARWEKMALVPSTEDAVHQAATKNGSSS